MNFAPLNGDLLPFQPFAGIDPADIVPSPGVAGGLDGDVAIPVEIVLAVASVGAAKIIAALRLQL